MTIAIVGIISFVVGALMMGIVCRNIYKKSSKLYRRIRELKMENGKYREMLKQRGVKLEDIKRRR